MQYSSLSSFTTTMDDAWRQCGQRRSLVHEFNHGFIKTFLTKSSKSLKYNTLLLIFQAMCESKERRSVTTILFCCKCRLHFVTKSFALLMFIFTT
jgi:hypothetical protein